MGFGFLGCNPDQTWDDAALAPRVGTRGTAGDKEFVLVQAAADIAKGNCCIITKRGEAQGVTTALADDSYPLCFPQTAISEDSYGWGQVKGDGEFRVGANCAADVSLATTINPGRLDDAETVGRISGAMLTAARAAGVGLAPGWCYEPRLDILE